MEILPWKICNRTRYIYLQKIKVANSFGNSSFNFFSQALGSISSAINTAQNLGTAAGDAANLASLGNLGSTGTVSSQDVSGGKEKLLLRFPLFTIYLLKIQAENHFYMQISEIFRCLKSSFETSLFFMHSFLGAPEPLRGGGTGGESDWRGYWYW